MNMKSKEVLPDLVSSQQMAYVQNRHIGESGRYNRNHQINKGRRFFNYNGH